MFNDEPESWELDMAYESAHAVECVECGKAGCDRSECPREECPVEALVEHERELMHPGCVAAFDRHTENRCTGDVCHCSAVPVLLADDAGEETTPVEPMTNAQIAKLDPLGIFSKEAA